MTSLNGYLHIMRTRNTLFLLVYSPRMPPEMVHLRGRLHQSVPRGQDQTWVDIRANCPASTFLETVLKHLSTPNVEWRLSVLEDASVPGF